MDLYASPSAVGVTDFQSYKMDEEAERFASKENRRHFALLGEHTALLWRNSRMTDIKILVRGKAFTAHKSVLTCYSPYFRRNLMRSEGSRTTMMLTNPSSDPTNLLYIYVTAKKLEHRHTWQRALVTMMRKFEEVIMTKDFLELNVEQLCEILSGDVIGARSEVSVYLAALKWLQRHYLEREQYISKVMKNVRFPIMTLEEIVACYHPPILPGIVEHPSVRNYLTDATCYVSAKMCGQADKFGSYNCVPRTYLLEGQPLELWDTSGFETSLVGESQENLAAKKIKSFYKNYLRKKRQNELEKVENDAAIILIQAHCRGYLTRRTIKIRTGPFKHSKRNSVEHSEGQLASIALSKVDLLTTDPCLRIAFSDHSLKSEGVSYAAKSITGRLQSNNSPVILMIGGMNPVKIDKIASANIMLRYHPVENKWERCDKIPKPLHHVCVVRLKENIYCIGGCDLNETVKGRMVATPHCFCFNYKEEKWSLKKSMHHARIYHGATVLFGLIYVVGGKDEKGELLSSIECYKAEKDAWYELKHPLPCPRMGMGVTSYADLLWVAGGMVKPPDKERIYIVKNVECYDPKTNLWIFTKPKLPSPMCLISLVNHQNKLYLIGGSGRQEHSICSVTDVYCFNEDEHEWQSIAPLPFPRHGVAAASAGNTLYVIGGLSSLHYTAVDDTIRLDTTNEYWISCKSLPSPLCGAAVITLPPLQS